MKIERFEDIEAWQHGRMLTRAIYKCTRQQEFARDFALRDQIRRAAVSITSNIAEGFERDGNREFLQGLSVAKGSCGEVRSQLYVALDEAYINQEEFERVYELSVHTSRLLARFIAYLQTTETRGLKFKREPRNLKPET